MNDPLRIAKVALQKVEGLAQKAEHHAEYLQKAIEEAEAAQPDALPKKGTEWVSPFSGRTAVVYETCVRFFLKDKPEKLLRVSLDAWQRKFEPLPDEPEQAQRKWVVMRLDNRDRPFVSAQTDSSVSRAEAERIAREAQGRLGPGVIYWAAPEPAEEVSP